MLTCDIDIVIFLERVVELAQVGRGKHGICIYDDERIVSFQLLFRKCLKVAIESIPLAGFSLAR